MRFVKFVAILWLCSLLTIVAVKQYGTFYGRLGELQSLGFGVCGALPCWHNILPGLTKWEQARLIMAKFGFDVDTEAYLQVEISNSVIAANMSDNNSVQTITMQDLDQQANKIVTLGEMIRMYGEPCRIIKGDVTNEYQFQFRSWIIAYTAIKNNSFSPNTKIQRFELIQTQSHDETPYDSICNKTGYTAVPWWGFASLD